LIICGGCGADADQFDVGGTDGEALLDDDVDKRSSCLSLKRSERHTDK